MTMSWVFVPETVTGHCQKAITGQMIQVQKKKKKTIINDYRIEFKK